MGIEPIDINNNTFPPVAATKQVAGVDPVVAVVVGAGAVRRAVAEAQQSCRGGSI